MKSVELMVELTEEQIKNCIVFLNRANITGAESEAMTIIKVALVNAKPIKKQED